KRFLASPEWRKQVQFSKALSVTLAGSEGPSKVEPTTRSSSWWQSAFVFLRAQSMALQFAMAAGIFVLLAGGVWIVLVNRDLRRQLESSRQTQAEIEQKYRSLEKQVDSEREHSQKIASELE